jgi:Cu(I)/Ag(I) efflux system membrane fusion protein
VAFQVDAYPGESFEAQVVTVDPLFNKKTRTFLIGAVCPETGGRLKAGMLVRSIIYAPLNAQGAIDGGAADGSVPLVIPAPAPLITGKRSVVYVALPDREGVFEGREVVLGPRAKDYYIVVGGLEEGERVVVNGNFKIDSAVQILAKSSMMSIEGGHSVTEHHHHGGSQVMHDHYWSERNRSRLEETEKPSSDGGPEAAMGSKEGDPRDRLPRTIHRRRPGAYGDSTRPVPGGIRP